MKVKERLQEYLLEKGIRKSHFEKEIGVSNGYINSLKDSPSAEKLELISNKYLDLNLSWLLTGEGSMLKEEHEANLIKVEHKQNTETQQEVVRIPYYDVDFAGGFNSAELFSNVMPSFYISSPTFERAEFACNLVGNSISRYKSH